MSSRREGATGVSHPDPALVRDRIPARDSAPTDGPRRARLPLTKPEALHLFSCTHPDCFWCDDLWARLLAPMRRNVA